MALLALPIIGRSLSLDDYNSFLVAMTSGSATTLVFGAISVTGISSIAEADTPSARLMAIGETASFLAAVSVVLALISCGLFLLYRDVTPGAWVIFIASMLTIAQGFLLSGDIYQVATGRGYLANVLQMLGSIVALALLLLTPLNVASVTAIYFGVPAIVQMGVSVGAFRRPLPPLVRFTTLTQLASRLSALLPALINSVSDYLKIFGSAMVVGAIAGDLEYAVYSTLVLMAARAVNPISLFVRPILPAYLDAQIQQDVQWLRKLSLLIAGGLAITTVLALAAATFFNLDLALKILPQGAEFGRADLFALALFVVGHAFCTLQSPFFVVSALRSDYARVQLFSVIFGLVAGASLSSWGLQYGMLVALGVLTYLHACLLCFGIPRFLFRSALPSS